MVGLLILLCIASFFMVLVVYGTFRRNRWGINFERAACPVCGNTQFPTIRKPTSVWQALWGGKTCPVCGTEIDKWGRQTKSGLK
jgi:prepilin signal peptidase PulO-like enzyme (type II secretory pathway)